MNMRSVSRLPRVVIVGRPNVGKSSLMNMLAGRKVSIVDPTAGVTRDRVSSEVELRPGGGPGDASSLIELIDTGGFGITGYEQQTDLTADIERQISRGLAEADVILFVVDVQTGVVPLDEEVANLLRTANLASPVIMVANKVDADNLETEAFNAMRLGFGEPVAISATTRHQKYMLVEAIEKALEGFDREAVTTRSAEDEESGATPLIALVGKRNAGKSTLTNALAGDERVIVSAQAGTTRDSVDVRFEMDGRSFIAIDTAGVRKTKSIKEDIDYYSHHRSLRSVRRADVVMLLIDATVPVSQVDEKLAAEIVKHFKPVVIVVNKWDLAEAEHTQEAYVEYLDQSLKGLSFAPIIFTSAQNAEGMHEVVAMAMNLHEQAGHRETTGKLNRLFEQIMLSHHPKSRLGKRAKIYFVTQLGVRPPSIVVFVNDPDLFDPAYQRFLIGRLRDELPFSEVPIELKIKARKSMSKDERRAAQIAEEGGG